MLRKNLSNLDRAECFAPHSCPTLGQDAQGQNYASASNHQPGYCRMDSWSIVLITLAVSYLALGPSFANLRSPHFSIVRHKMCLKTCHWNKNNLIPYEKACIFCFSHFWVLYLFEILTLLVSLGGTFAYVSLIRTSPGLFICRTEMVPVSWETIVRRQTNS